MFVSSRKRRIELGESVQLGQEIVNRLVPGPRTPKYHGIDLTHRLDRGSRDGILLPDRVRLGQALEDGVACDASADAVRLDKARSTVRLEVYGTLDSCGVPPQGPKQLNI